MKCKNCGAEMAETSKFCVNCGTQTNVELVYQEPVAATDVNQSVQPTAEKAKKKAPWKALIPVGIIAVLIIWSVINSLVGYRFTINKYYDAIENADVDKYLSTRTNFAVKASQELYGSKSDYETAVEEDLFNRLENLQEQYGDDIKISYKILEKESGDLEDLFEGNEYYFNRIDEYGINIVTGLVYLRVEVTVEGSEDETTYEETMQLVKYNGKWRFIAY